MKLNDISIDNLTKINLEKFKKEHPLFYMEFLKSLTDNEAESAYIHFGHDKDLFINMQDDNIYPLYHYKKLFEIECFKCKLHNHAVYLKK